MRAVGGAGPFVLAEGPLSWPDGSLTWVDVMAGALYAARPAGDDVTVSAVHRIGPPLGCAVRCADGGFLLAAGGWLWHLTGDANPPGATPGAIAGITAVADATDTRDVGAVDDAGVVASAGILVRYAEVETGRARLNDGKCDPAGRLWVGSLSPHHGEANLYRVDGGAVTKVLSGLTAANGLGWSPDQRTMYVTDSGARAVDAFDFEVRTGELDRRRPLLRLDDGKPDGLAVDDEGCLWVAVWDGAAVHRYDPDGALMRTVQAPVRRPTSCCFGGDRWWVTAADAGLFSFTAEVGAPPATPYGGAAPDAPAPPT